MPIRICTSWKPAAHARWALLSRGPQGWRVELRCVAYDWDAAADQAERQGRGDWADALRTGRVGRWEADVVRSDACRSKPGA